ncbi:expansin-like protein [Uliginosibacterium gangwonense]|uniref:expansin-like protein n=1 Tax=Uliginosibacterium gangwonense TaxID=392736 RepID=UPI0003A1EFC5|nr:expansin-like protein [Uliginosibacterium gangwonense]
MKMPLRVDMDMQSKPQKWWMSVGLALWFAVLVGCGGGGSSGGSASSSAGGSSGSQGSVSSAASAGSSLPATCSGVCNAATPVSPSVSSTGGLGNVTEYSTSASNGGACNYGSTNVMYYAAINVNVASGDGLGQWQGGKSCGQCAQTTVLTSQGLKTVTVRIMDKCADANCGIDLGGSAPGQVMVDGFGRYTGQWRFVSCKGVSGVSDGAPSLYVKDGSSVWWSRIQVRNPATAVSSISYQGVGDTTVQGGFAFDSSIENFYIVPTSILQSSTSQFTITVNYVDGTTATVQLTPAQLGNANASYSLL